ncbi:MAG: hypothetical protein ABJC13_01785 [Acidobacteriota bacterium]
MAEPQIKPTSPAARADEFFRHESFEELARAQGVRPATRLESYEGGWPADQLDDGFEEALLAWRRIETA